MTVRLIHGDCLDVLRGLPDASADAVVTDPPYIVGYTGRWNSDWQPIHGDASSAWVEPVFAEIYRVLRADSLAVSFYGWPHADVFVTAWKRIGFRLLSHLVFVKNRIGLGYFTRGKHEQAYLLAKGRPPRPAVAAPDVYPFTRVHRAEHPTQKPLDAITPLIALTCPPGGTVLDPFMGSGTTGVACVQEGRSFIGIEREAAYYDIAARRIAAAEAARQLPLAEVAD